MRTLTQLKQDFNSEPSSQALSYELPPWIYEDLSKIQSAWGVPLEALIFDAFEFFISENWDLKHNRPKKLRWQKEDEKKPGSYTRRRRNKLLNGGYSNE